MHDVEDVRSPVLRGRRVADLGQVFGVVLVELLDAERRGHLERIRLAHLHDACDGLGSLDAVAPIVGRLSPKRDVPLLQQVHAPLAVGRPDRAVFAVAEVKAMALAIGLLQRGALPLVARRVDLAPAFSGDFPWVAVLAADINRLRKVNRFG